MIFNNNITVITNPKQLQPMQSTQISFSSPFHHVRKFHFSNFTLANQINKQIRQKLISFDDNKNGNFQQTQIKQALFKILNSKEEQLQYCVKNVFRYDVNSDGFVTYDQFVRFCTQLHFGEIAIQRMHSRGEYQFGRQKIMSQGEFVKTIQYCFDSLPIKVADADIAAIFQQIDLDRDGFISYEDYFTFLREYFGQNGTSPANQQKYWQQIRRVAHLIFPQIQSLLIEYDIYKSLQFLKPDIQTFIQKTFSLPNRLSLTRSTFSKSTLNYRQSMLKIVQIVFRVPVQSGAGVQYMSGQEFVRKFNEELLVGVGVKPVGYVLMEIYEYLSNVYRVLGGQAIYAVFLNNLAKVFPQTI